MFDENEKTTSHNLRVVPERIEWSSRTLAYLVTSQARKAKTMFLRTKKNLPSSPKIFHDSTLIPKKNLQKHIPKMLGQKILSDIFSLLPKSESFFKIFDKSTKSLINFWTHYKKNWNIFFQQKKLDYTNNFCLERLEFPKKITRWRFWALGVVPALAVPGLFIYFTYEVKWIVSMYFRLNWIIF